MQDDWKKNVPVHILLLHIFYLITGNKLETITVEAIQKKAIQSFIILIKIAYNLGNTVVC